MPSPLSESGVAILAMHNGIRPDQAPAAWNFASNKYMADWLNALGYRLEAGLPVKHETGRWLLPSEIEL